MARSLTGDWTRDLPHSKPALYHYLRIVDDINLLNFIYTVFYFADISETIPHWVYVDYWATIEIVYNTEWSRRLSMHVCRLPPLDIGIGGVPFFKILRL